MSMRRTQIYLDEETKALAQWQAKIEGTSMSHILRASVKAYVKPKNKNKVSDFIQRIEALNKKYPTPPGTPTDIAMEHDHYLYGTPKKYSKK